jgi:hypothetical protein
MRVRALVLVVATLSLAGPVDAHAQRGEYRDPPGFRGRTAVPATEPQGPATPAPAALSEVGSFPDVLVDEAGTGHVVFNEGRGAGADVVVYCRLKRGAGGCDARTDLVWEKSYGPGDDPSQNVAGPPKILRVGDQLVVLSRRFPTRAPKPDNERADSTVLQWVSEDGGSTWAGPAIIGKFVPDSAGVMGGENDPAIVALGADPYCSAPGPSNLCVESYRSGQYTAAAGNLSTGRDQGYSPSLALDGGLPLAAFADLDANTILRRWTGAGSVMDATTWSAPTVIKAQEPALAGGPSGTYLLSRPGYAQRFDVRRLRAQADGTVAAEAPTPVSDGDGDKFARAHQDPSGRLHVAWQRARGGNEGVYLRSAGPAGFGAPQRLIDGLANGQINLAATADGGGFAVLNHTGSINSEGQIIAAGFGPQAATGKPGLGGLAGGAGRLDTTCQKINFGAFTVDATAGCFLRGTGANAGVFVTEAEIDLAGLRIVPDPGCKLVIDPRALSLQSINCSVRVLVSAADVGDIVLFHGPIARDLDKLVPGSTLFEFPVGLYRADILGFKVAANIKVRLERDGVRIPLDLRLPPVFGGFSANAELRADATRGLWLSSLHIHIGPVPLGVLIIKSIDVDYQAAQQRWTGRGSITVPAGGTLDLTEVSFRRGEFERASIAFTPANAVPIGPFVYVLSVHGGFALNPLQVQAGATLGAGLAVAGEAPVKVRGTFTMTFPKRGPAEFRLDGQLSVLFVDLARGYLRFLTDGYASFGGHAGLDVGPLSINANAAGFVDARNGGFSAFIDGGVEVCAHVGPFDGCGGIDGKAAVSSEGFAACAGIDFPEPVGRVSAGIAGQWRQLNPGVLINPALLATHIKAPCSTDDYVLEPAHAAQAGASTVRVRTGLPTVTILVKGAGGQPRVQVTGPGATVRSGTATSAGYVMTVPGIDAAYVVLRRPRAGVYTVRPLAGSPAIASVLVGEGYRPARVHARLTGRGGRRRITYRIADAGHGHRVRFAERGTFGTRIIGATRRARGTLRFTPADVPGRRRTLLALIEHDGIVERRATLARFRAPAPTRPSAVSRLRARRSATTVTVRWRGARRAHRYAVTLTGSHGTRVGRLVARGSVTFSAVRRDERVTVTVQPLSPKLRPGPARRITLREARP